MYDKRPLSQDLPDLQEKDPMRILFPKEQFDIIQRIYFILLYFFMSSNIITLKRKLTGSGLEVCFEMIRSETTFPILITKFRNWIESQFLNSEFMEYSKISELE